MKKPAGDKGEQASDKDAPEADLKVLAKRIEKMEKALLEMNERLKTIESRLPPEKK